jgi:hypothetical protein
MPMLFNNYDNVLMISRRFKPLSLSSFLGNILNYVSILLIGSICFPVAASADTYRCRTANGQTLISSSPCDDISRTVSAIPSGPDNTAGIQKAQSDLERQKAWLRQREIESGQQPTLQTPQYVERRTTGDAFDGEGRDRIHSCLMAATATSGVSAYQVAQRRVNCYQGTYGLREECEMRVTASTGLTTNQEHWLRQQCRGFSK